MQIEDYFDFHADNDIRLKGHRIGIESVLYEYIHRAQTPKEIAVRFPTLTLEHIYAAILYYLHNKKQIHGYMSGWTDHEDRMYEEQKANPTPAMPKNPLGDALHLGSGFPAQMRFFAYTEKYNRGMKRPGYRLKTMKAR